MRTDGAPRMRTFFLYLMVLLYVGAGINHFVHPGPYMTIMPPWLPYPRELVLISGACELGLGLLLLPPATRPFAAWGLIALLVAVFPANLQMALNFHRDGNPSLWLALVRLPLQLPLIWWAWKYTAPGR